MDIVFRATFLFVFVFALMRLVGRRELSSLEPFDLILLIVLGDAIQQGLTQDDYSVTGAVLAIGTIALLQVGASYFSFRFQRVRSLFDGEPIVLVQDGKTIDRNMKRERLTMDDLTEEARGQQIASIDDVAWAVLEPSGKISFIEKK